MHRAHAYEFEETRILQTAALATGHVYGLMIIGYQLFGKFPGRGVLHLRKIRVTGNKIKKSAGMYLQIRGRIAFECEIEFAKSSERRQRLHRGNEHAAFSVRNGICLPGKVLSQT